MGRVIVFLAAVVVIAVVAFTVFTIVDCVRTSHRDKVEQRKLDRERQQKILDELGIDADYEVSKKKKKKNKKSKKDGDSDISAQDVLGISDWFAIKYPDIAIKSFSQGNFFEDTYEALKAKSKRDSQLKKYSNMLPEGYKKDLDAISVRISQISKRTDDPHIAYIISSYRESIEKSTRNYIELAEAPVRNDSIRSAMSEIEQAIASIPDALDAILASCYEQDSMEALIEAGSLKAVVEHNKMMFLGSSFKDGQENLERVGSDFMDGERETMPERKRRVKRK